MGLCVSAYEHVWLYTLERLLLNAYIHNLCKNKHMQTYTMCMFMLNDDELNPPNCFWTLVCLWVAGNRRDPSTHQRGVIGDTAQAPICFQLGQLRGYFITVIMIYSLSIWVRLFWHTCNTQVGGTIGWIRSVAAHACVCGQRNWQMCVSVSFLQKCRRDKSIPLRYGPLRVSSRYHIIRHVRPPRGTQLHLRNDET